MTKGSLYIPSTFDLRPFLKGVALLARHHPHCTFYSKLSFRAAEFSYRKNTWCDLIKGHLHRDQQRKMFIISAPIKECFETSWLKLKVVAYDFASFSNVSIPNFRTTSKVELHELAKDLLHMDHCVENLFRSLLFTFEDVLEQEGVDLLEYLIVQKRSYGENITDFEWNMNKYSPYLLLFDLCHVFYNHFHELDQQMRHNIAMYKENLKIAKEYIAAEESLVTQNFTRIVREETIIDTEYIQSVYVAVPYELTNTWLEVYETIHDSVVACSSCFITEDNDYKLFSVVIVRENFAEFRENCAKFGFITRRFRTDPNGYARKLHEKRKLEEATRYQNVLLIQWLKVIADELFDLLIHIKILRAYVASSIRYDKEEYQIIMFYPRKNLSQQLQSELTEFYEKQQEINVTNEPNSERKLKKGPTYLPYLIYKVNLAFPEY
ncbi:unnamed protein product [Onchocerca ochengi]|uniref:V-type proton ATPase subunit C n=2 Tax=Onchocerca TaxID=6281 RepID=A0A182EME9_ONCOC|nr:unnamed protein product [Onchocerca ochengi]